MVTTRRRSRSLIALSAALTVSTAVLVCAWGRGTPQAPRDGRPPIAMTAAPSTTARPCGTVSDTLVPACGAWLGMWPRSDADGRMSRDLVSNLVSLEQRAGRRFDVITRYYGWGDLLPDTDDAGWRDTGHLLLIDLRAKEFRSGRYVRWADIAAGAHDGYLTTLATRLRAFGVRVFFSFNQEPEHELEAGGTATGGVADYVAAYRHIHDVFRDAGATNVVWVWWVMGYLGHVGWYPALYPGDRYVDWISYDPYDFNTCHGIPHESPEESILPFLTWLESSRVGTGKPVMLSEFGSHGDDRGDWYAGVGRLVKATPRIKAIIPFNSRPGRCDLRLGSSPDKWRGFAAIASDPYFNQPRPAADR